MAAEAAEMGRLRVVPFCLFTVDNVWAVIVMSRRQEEGRARPSSVMANMDIVMQRP